MATVWLNGQFVDESAATVSVRDTGLLHAAGVFTTMRCYGGRVFRQAEHLHRLRQSCEALFIPLQFKDAQLAEAVDEVLKRDALTDARLRLTVTRGSATQDPVHGLRLEPTVFITAAELEPYPAEFYDRGMTVILLDEQKLNPYDLQAGHKTLNYFSRLAALRAATHRRAGEALWFNVHNYLQSASLANIFIVENGSLVTPPSPQEMRDPTLAAAMPYPKSAVLPGITRAAIMELAKEEEIPMRLEAIDVERLLAAEEVFMTNSVMGVMPISHIEAHPMPNTIPGPITRRLMDRYAALVERRAD